MSNLTALQQAMRIVEQYAPQLFDTYNANGRRFVDEMTKLLDVEREQLEKAYKKGCMDEIDKRIESCVEESCKTEYNETYKGGEQ